MTLTLTCCRNFQKTRGWFYFTFLIFSSSFIAFFRKFRKFYMNEKQAKRKGMCAAIKALG
jgi:hypothetical protein